MQIKHRIKIFLLVIFAIFFTLAVRYPAQSYYPSLTIDAKQGDDNVRINFVFDKQANLKNCFQLLGRTAESSLNNCKECQIIEIQCNNQLDKLSKLYLAELPLNFYSVRMTDGVAVFYSDKKEFTTTACQIAEQHSNLQNPVKCYTPNSIRQIIPHNFWQNYNFIGLFILTFLVSFTVCWLINRYEHLHAHLSLDHSESGPQKLHSEPIPRIGGIAIIMSLLFTALFLLYQPLYNVEYQFAMLILAAAPAFLGGLIEDLTKRVGVIERLVLTMFSGLLAIWLLGLILPPLPLGFDFAKQLLMILPIAIVFTCFAVGGVANAINLIDGVNGLASSIIIIATIAITFVAGQLGDSFVFITGIVVIGSTIGFLCWNWPKAKIFLGDGGAYLLGFFVAEMAISLVIRNQQVSPWLLVLFLIHPIYETLFSIFRRSVISKQTAGAPDAKHLHQLIFALLKNLFPNAEHNSLVAPLINIVVIIFTSLACFHFTDTRWQLILIVSYCVIYTISYYLLIYFLTKKNNYSQI